MNHWAVQESRAGTLGWIGLALYIAAWDILASETLSSAWWRALAGKRSRPLVLIAWAYVTSHLFLRVPRKILVRW